MWVVFNESTRIVHSRHNTEKQAKEAISKMGRNKAGFSHVKSNKEPGEHI